MHSIQFKKIDLKDRIFNLEKLLKNLKEAPGISQKLIILNKENSVRDFLNKNSGLNAFLKKCSPQQEYAVKSILAIQQGPVIFKNFENTMILENAVSRIIALDKFHVMLETLITLEKFYTNVGGIIGYYLIFLHLLYDKKKAISSPSDVAYKMPIGIDLSKESSQVLETVCWGVSALKNLAEIYPVGGSGDRFHLQNDATGEAMPVATLTFCGCSLLEGIVRDLQAREYLYYKLHDMQLTTPIALMTSLEKNNHQHIVNLCEQNHWFSRPKDSFQLFAQPLVPMITEKGDWVMQDALSLMLKPGGHGVIWVEAKEKGIFDWFQSQNRTHALIRQINNPVAGTDNGLLALEGFGSHHKKVFGFASCKRKLNASEGMDVLIETIKPNRVEYCLTNVEYTEFTNKGIQDIPESDSSEYSQFPANTNILYVDLKLIQPAIEQNPIPGMLINMKNTVTKIDEEGKKITIAAGRLESTMQNIADVIVDEFPNPLENVTSTSLKSFITYNERRKTLSVTKKAYIDGGSILETPEGCLYELLQNHYDLLTAHCGMKLPLVNTIQEFLNEGPSFFVLIHPALGPLYHIISQKMKGGSLSFGSELQLEIAELEIKDLHLDGSLLIKADAVMGIRDSKGILSYSEESGKCTLKSVHVKNKGIDRQAKNHYWKNNIQRKETLKIVLHGNAEFYAEDVTFSGAHTVEVMNGYRTVAYMKGKAVHYLSEKITAPTWHWKYRINGDNQVVLQKTAPHIA